jgi:hypothetical protein
MTFDNYWFSSSSPIAGTLVALRYIGYGRFEGSEAGREGGRGRAKSEPESEIENNLSPVERRFRRDLGDPFASEARREGVNTGPVELRRHGR